MSEKLDPRVGSRTLASQGPAQRLRISRWFGERREYAFGFLAQVLSSCTNFGLSIVAGRLLGPAGLGMVFLGFSAYLLASAFQRALLTVPLVTSASPLPALERRRIIGVGLTIVGVSSAGCAGVVAGVGVAIGGSTGRGLLLFAPWIAPALVQGLLRAILFQERRSAFAAASDGTWLLVMAPTSALAWATGADWAVVASWGAGGVAGMAVGLIGVGVRPGSLRTAVAWWRREARTFGSWLAGQEAVAYIADYGIVFVLAVVLGTRALGGLRAAESLFSPFSLLAGAIMLPGLPAVSRALAVSAEAAKSLATRLTLVAVSAASAYLLLMIVAGRSLAIHLFGHPFGQFASLVWPMGLWQILAAAGLGPGTLLRAQRRGRAVLLAGGIASVAGVVLVTGLAWKYGLTAAAWGFAAEAGVALVVLVLLARASPSRLSDGYST